MKKGIDYTESWVIRIGRQKTKSEYRKAREEISERGTPWGWSGEHPKR